jgi:antitoxin (DNA-binding transcriptional repressor) of toxin-antitoxin stability system
MKRPIPKFKNESAEREFWATHDSTDYLDWRRAKRVATPKPKPASRHVKRVSVSDLRHNFAAVERMLRRGETIEITKRKCVIGKLTPAAPEAKPQMPDFMARLRRIYGNRKLKVSAAQMIARDRDRY